MYVHIIENHNTLMTNTTLLLLWIYLGTRKDAQTTHSYLGRFNIVKTLILKFKTEYNTPPIKIQ